MCGEEVERTGGEMRHRWGTGGEMVDISSEKVRDRWGDVGNSGDSRRKKGETRRRNKGDRSEWERNRVGQARKGFEESIFHNDNMVFQLSLHPQYPHLIHFPLVPFILPQQFSSLHPPPSPRVYCNFTLPNEETP